MAVPLGVGGRKEWGGLGIIVVITALSFQKSEGVWRGMLELLGQHFWKFRQADGVLVSWALYWRASWLLNVQDSSCSALFRLFSHSIVPVKSKDLW